jgi:radical SAM superfamily enzyme YgiQ (UPF0313 family)
MKIALVFPKSTFLSNPLVWPPLGLWYLAAQLEAQGHETDFFDLSLRELPKDGEFDQLWLSANSAQMYEVRKIAEITKDFSHTTTVFGGSAVWADPESIYKDLSFNLFVVGEGDRPQTIKSILKLSDLKCSKKGMFWPEMEKDLDWVLPPVRRWSLDYHAYMSDQDGNEYRMASLFTTRGCPMSCAFCESGRKGVIWGNRTRYEPLWVVEEQIKECKDLGFTGLAYYDDVFILNRRRTLQLLDLNTKYDMRWRCFLRSDILCDQGGKEYLERMRDSGLIEVFVGVESADNRIKKNIHKGTTIEQDTKVLEWCRELGIRCKMSFVIGLPGESYDSMNATRDWILKHRPDIVQIDRLIPFPGTPLTKNPDEYDLKYEETIPEEWFFRGNEGSGRSFVSTSHLSREQIDEYLYELDEEMIREGLSTYDH